MPHYGVPVLPNVIVLVIPMCSVMNPIVAEAEESYDSVLEAVYLMPMCLPIFMEAVCVPNMIFPMEANLSVTGRRRSW